MTKTKLALIITGTLVLSSCMGCIGLAAIGSQMPDRPTQSAPAAPPTDMEAVQDASRAELQVENLAIKTGEYGVKFVTGSVTNMSQRKYDLVSVQINLFDADGAVIGSTMTNIANLTPGQLWKFKAAILEREAVRAEIKEISAY